MEGGRAITRGALRKKIVRRKNNEHKAYLPCASSVLAARDGKSCNGISAWWGGVSLCPQEKDGR